MGEREKRKRREERKNKEKKEKRKEKRETNGEKSKRCIRPMGVKHPLRTVKRLYYMKKGGAEKSRKRGRRDRKDRGKHSDRGRIEM